MQKQYNDLIISPISPTDYVFGVSSPLDELVVIKDIFNCLPRTEQQCAIFFDTWNCVVFSLLNTLEVIFKYYLKNNLFSAEQMEFLREYPYFTDETETEVNFSDRFLGAMSGTKVGYGNSGNIVANALKSFGCVPEVVWSWDMMSRDSKINNEEQYYKDPSEEVKAIGKEFARLFPIKWQWIMKDDFKKVRDITPFQVYVKAWYKNEDGIYYNPTESQNHAVVELPSDKIFDSYDPYIKQLTENYNYCNYGIALSITKPINNNPMKLNNETLYQIKVRKADGSSYGTAGYSLDGRLIIDGFAELMFTWIQRSSRESFVDGVKMTTFKTKPLFIEVTESDFKSYKKVNLKGEAL